MVGRAEVYCRGHWAQTGGRRFMTDVSTVVEARIRIAVKDKLGDTATITRLKQEKDVVYLEVVAPLGQQKTLEAIEEALENIGLFLQQENVSIVHVNSKPTWIASKS